MVAGERKRERVVGGKEVYGRMGPSSGDMDDKRERTGRRKIGWGEFWKRG
jgi:hypothetical protein